MTYFFQLGHQPRLSAAEIQAVFCNFKGCQISAIKNSDTLKYLLLETDEKINSEKMIKKLGGTIKIAEKVGENKGAIEFLANYLPKVTPTGKINFALSGKDAERIAIATKKQLKPNYPIRYIQLKNTATILHNDLVEKQTDLTLLPEGIFVTRAIQPIEEFSRRDYERPEIDSRSGMLPPKLARIMINLAEGDEKQTLLDPFCGSGTILVEALDLGFKKIIGSDISAKAIADSQKNIDWYKETYHLSTINLQLIKSDVSQLTQQIKLGSVDLVITEPYLGRPLHGDETTIQLQRQTQELRKLYIESFQTFRKLLKKGGTVIFLIPRFYQQGEWIQIDCLDDIIELGFKVVPLDPEEGCLLYWRTNQHIGREIWKLVLANP